jgi:hypothetical protein
MIEISRRNCLSWVIGAGAPPGFSRMAIAKYYPTRPVHIMVGFAAGGPNDISGRLMSQWLSEHLGQQFVVENHTGAGGNVATEMVVRAAAAIVATPTLAQGLNSSGLYQAPPGETHLEKNAIQGAGRTPPPCLGSVQLSLGPRSMRPCCGAPSPTTDIRLRLLTGAQ